MIHDWISFDEWVRREAERKQSSTVIHGTNGRIEINGTPIGTVTGWAIEYDRAAERGKQMSKKQRISALEREVKQLMGTVEQLREQQRSNSSAVRSAIVSIADIQREQSSNATVLRDLIAKVRQHEIDHAEGMPFNLQAAHLQTAINELRAEMQKGDRNLGEIVTNNRNHAILDKRQAEQHLAAGLNTMQRTNDERLTALEEWAKLTERHNEKLNHLELIDKLLAEQSSTIAAEIARVSGRVSQTREYVEQLHDRVDTVSKSAHTHHPA